MNSSVRPLLIGWSQTDITPPQPAFLAGQLYSRLSEGVLDPVTATVLALDNGEHHALFVSCDLVAISSALQKEVRSRSASLPGLNPQNIILHATHTHTGPEIRIPDPNGIQSSAHSGIPIPGAMPTEQVVAFIAGRIAHAIREAWSRRSPGEILFGQAPAVIGRNRRWVNVHGRTTMYGDTNTPEFSHIEGYEDHSLNLLATRDAKGRPTGLVVNVPCPSQVDEHLFQISADYWQDTRIELRRRFGADLFILPQCSAAGDQSPRPLYDKAAAERMRQLTGRSLRKEIAVRIADAVSSILPVIETDPVSTPCLRHEILTLDLPLNELSTADAERAREEMEKLRQEFEHQQILLESNPALRTEPRWYVKASAAFRRMKWHQRVLVRYDLQQQGKTSERYEIHAVRLGPVAFATNPFEYYLDFGCHIKARSPAVQTFLVQLAGEGTYVPSPRSLAGGGYGSVPASNHIGPSGGRILALETVNALHRLWAEPSP